MSKRAEQRALEAYPVNMQPLNYQDLIEQFGGKTEIDVNTYPRCLFQEGYEQAEKDTIERAVAWLKENTSKHIMGIGIGIDEPMDYFIPDFVWEEFRKAMEEQK